MSETPAPEAGVSTSTFERIKLYATRNEARLSATFFVAGFLFDIVTLGRIDSWLTIGQQAVYLTLTHRGAGADAAGRRASLRRTCPLRRGLRAGTTSIAIRRSTSCSARCSAPTRCSSSRAPRSSFPSASSLRWSRCLVANEMPRFKALGLPFKFALLGLCWLAYFAYVIPVLIGQTGLVIFLLSLGVGALPLLLVALRIPQPARRRVLVPLGCVVIGFLTFYFFRLIPPVPLSIPFMGVYHGVERTEAGYRLSHERPLWRIWHNGDQWFRAQPGDRVFVYFRVFSPSRFQDEVVMRWYLDEPARGWVLQDTIPIKIVGGREQGFRGYGAKTRYQPGSWKVQIETTDAREIGRIYFSLEAAPAATRAFTLETD